LLQNGILNLTIR